MATPDFPLPKGFGWQYQFILWLQSFHTPWLDKLATAVSYLGTESFYMLIVPVVFMAFSRKYGMRLAYVFFTSMFFNAWLKSVLHIARPIGVPGVRSAYLSSATGLSMPSGHSQGPMTFFAAVRKWSGRKFILWLGFLLVLAIGASRVYLGLHWPMDVIVGWALGWLIGSAGWTIGRWWSYREIPFHFKLVFAVLFPAILFYFNRDPAGAEYATFLFSMGTGAVIEGRYLGTDIVPIWWKRICAAVIGIGGILAIQWILHKHMMDFPWRLLRDLLIGWWATILAPWLFTKVDLYTRRASELENR